MQDLVLELVRELGVRVQILASLLLTAECISRLGRILGNLLVIYRV